VFFLGVIFSSCVQDSTKQGSGAASTGGGSLNKLKATNITPANFNEDTASTITLSYTDTDSRKATSCSLSSLNKVTISQACTCDAAGVCTVGVTGASNAFGSASFVFRVSIGSELSAQATASFSLNPVADVPTTQAVTLLDSILEDIESGFLTLNYVDPDGDRAGASDCSITLPSNLTITTACTCDVILGNCKLKVTGNSNYFGSGGFSYSVRANGDWSNISAASLTITGVDDAPVASNITPANFNEDTQSIITLSYSDLESHQASSCAISSPTNVTVTSACACSAGTCTVGVTGTNNYNGSASFNYTVTANTKTSNQASASLTIDAVNDAPIANNITPASFNEDTQSIITLSYTDPESDLATACSVSSLTNVTEAQSCSCDGSGVCTVGVTGTNNYNGSASFNYTVTAAAQTSIAKSATLTINPVNDAPTINAITDQYTAQNQTLNSSVTINDIDGSLPCGTVLSGSSSNTGLVINSSITFGGSYPNCSMSIVPENNQSGTSTITVTVNDGGLSNNTSFLLTVRAPVSKTFLFGDVGDPDSYSFSSGNIANSGSGIAYLISQVIDQTHSTSGEFPSLPGSLMWDVANSMVKRSDTVAAPYSEAYNSKITDAFQSSAWTHLNIKTSLPFGKEIPDYPSIALITNEQASGNGTEKYNSISFVRTGTPTYSQAAKISNGILLNGTNQYFEAAFNAHLNPVGRFTVCSWVKATSVGGGYNSFFMSRDTNTGYSFYVNNNYEFWIGTGSGYTQLVSTTVPSTSAFELVCGSYENGVAKLSVNGVVEASATTDFVANSTRPTRIGAGTTETTASQYFGGVVDDMMVFNRELNSTELSNLNSLTVYLPQQSGATLANLFYGSESTTDYPSLASSTLKSNLVALWHFNENNGATNLKNSATKTTNAIVGSVTVGIAGKLNNGVGFDGTTSYLTGTTLLSTNVQSNTFTAALWFKTTSTLNEKLLSFAAAHSPIGINAGKMRFTLNNANSSAGAKVINDGNWHHVVVTGNASAYRVYVDGNTSTADISYTQATNYAMGTSITIGRRSGNANYFTGTIDEAAVWSRVLSNTEITQLFRRGANRLNIDARTCAQSNCSDGSFSGTTVSELNNVDSLGYVYNTLPRYAFSLSNNRYFQYQLNFVSDVNASGPDVKQAIIEPSHNFYSYSEDFVVTQNGLNFKTLSNLAETLGVGCSSGVRYQLSNDKINWKYYNGSTWATGSSYSTANTLAQINSGLSLYTSASPTVSDPVYIKAYLMSNGATPCELDQLILNGHN